MTCLAKCPDLVWQRRRKCLKAVLQAAELARICLQGLAHPKRLASVISRNPTLCVGLAFISKELSTCCMLSFNADISASRGTNAPQGTEPWIAPSASCSKYESSVPAPLEILHRI